MRAVLLTLLTAVLALPAAAQSNVDEWRSALAGTWAETDDVPDLRLTVDTTAEADTLRLKVAGSHAPAGVDHETIVCTLRWPAARALLIRGCFRTTLSRKAPPRDVTLRFPPQSQAGRGLRDVTRRLVGNPERSGDSLTVGIEERFRLVKKP